MNFCCNNARNACFSGDHVRSTPRCGPRRSVIGTAGVDPEPTFPDHHPPPCQGLCQTVLPSTEYDPQSHKNGKSAQKPDNSRHLFKYIHRSFLWLVFDFGQRCMATPLLIAVTDRSTFFVNPIQDSHTLVTRPINRAAAIQLKRTGGRTPKIPEGQASPQPEPRSIPENGHLCNVLSRGSSKQTATVQYTHQFR